MRRVVLGTRGSDLARAQTAMVEAALRFVWPTLEIGVEVITTSGDERGGVSPIVPVNRRAGRKGLFTSEIERALRDGAIDVAVHSAKDLPSDAAEELEICTALERAAVDDVLITKEKATLLELPARVTIATGSVRRQHQLRLARPDAEVVDLRGNVPTRLRKLTENAWDGIILARAGLERLGFDTSAERPLLFGGREFHTSGLPRETFVPAGGQGIVALQVRSADAEVRSLVEAVSHTGTLGCLRAEREFLRLLQGDCDSPVGVVATIDGGAMELRAQVFGAAGEEPLTGELRAPLAEQQPEQIAAALFQEMYGQEK